jgi:DNA-binding beta-propeller fold protein YncE
LAASAGLAAMLVALPIPPRSVGDADAAATGPEALSALLGRQVPICARPEANSAAPDPVALAAYENCLDCGPGKRSRQAWRTAGVLPRILPPPRTQPSVITVSNPAAPLAGMLPVINAHNVYSETTHAGLSPAVAGALPLVYVPNVASNSVDEINPVTMKVVNRFGVGLNPQHIIPSWDLKTLWVANDAENTYRGSVTPIDPMTGKAGNPIPVDDPYNMYFTPDGKSAIIVAEARQRLDFRDPHTMALQYSVSVPQCAGINHADFSIDGKIAIFTCEFGGALAKIDMVDHTVLGMLKLSKGGMPQDVRSSPDGKTFFVADMHADGVFLIDVDTFKEVGFIATGIGTHGLYPSRDGKKLYVSNRGTHLIRGNRHGEGSVSVVDFATRKVEYTWAIPGGGSPDMGNVSADGKQLWLSGRYDDVVYVFDTTTGAVNSIPVDHEPHGLTIWPQPGRYSLGHTGLMR